MRIPALAAPFVLTCLLCACTLEPRPEPPAAQPAVEAAAPQAPVPAAPAFTEDQIRQGLNQLINDTAPASDEYLRRREALAPAAQVADLDPGLRLVLAQALAFDPPRLRQRWQEHQQAQEGAAALYAANPPENTAALEGARVVRRLGPALYLVRLTGDDTVFLSSTRRFKNGARLKGLAALERPRPKPDRSKGDLVDELEDQPRTFVEITRQEAKMREARRAPVLAQLRQLDARGDELARGVAGDLARLDALTRDINNVIGPDLLPRAAQPAPASLIRKVRRVAHTYSRGQYYRYALPLTGRPQVDAVLKGYLEERKGEMQALLRSTGIGRGRARANTDRIAFSAFTAAPGLLSIRFEEQRDTGGAHPNQAFATFVFDLKRQSVLGLADLFHDAPAALAVLSDLAARRMELVLDGLVFPEGLAPKKENFDTFVLDGADLVFTFPPYQVASYAQGPQSLRVPLFHPRLRPLLSPALLDALAGR